MWKRQRLRIATHQPSESGFTREKKEERYDLAWHIEQYFLHLARDNDDYASLYRSWAIRMLRKRIAGGVVFTRSGPIRWRSGEDWIEYLRADGSWRRVNWPWRGEIGDAILRDALAVARLRDDDWRAE